MTTLTADQITQIRMETGDDFTPYDLSDAQLDAIYLDPAQGNRSLGLTNVFVLRRRRGKWVNTVDDTGNITGISSRSSQKYTQITELLAYWESVMGISAGQQIGVGISATSGGMQRRDQQSLNAVFNWQADAFVNRVLTNDPEAIEALTSGDTTDPDDD